ncbi:MAG: long-chain fatty acid--CoA ligase [Candidatus Heimdallarchaeota archaeon]|nr:MAG: long-chain fatty acid--CoA ligase [Candidatus Heimdallarchaeota archaeon]
MEIVKGFSATSQTNYQLNVTTLLKHAARSFGKQEIVSRKHDGSLFRYTYKEAYERIKRLANSLVSLRIEVGEKIGVLEWNTYRHFEIYYGLPGTGAVMLLLNLRLSQQELSYVVNHAEAKFIFVDENLLHVAEAIAPFCKTVKGYVIITDKPLSDISTSLEPIYSYEEMLGEASPDYDWPIIEETSAYSACYTSGTTGRPKGVYYSHRDVYLQALMYAANASISIKDTVFQLVPMFHVLGWGTPYAATIVGAKLVFPGRYSLKNLEDLTTLLVEEKVTMANGAPAILMPMLEYIRKMEPKPDLTGVRIISGASEPPVAMMKDYMDLTGAEIIHSYGSTEAHAIVTLNRVIPILEKGFSEEDKWDFKRKQGYIVVGLDIKIVDENGRELPHDGESAGEVLLRGPWVSGSYYNAPESEAQFSDEGYFRSGDVGTISPEGYLKITDRLKDLIKSGGEWISSVDMENALISYPPILEAAVVGCPHPKWEERPLALVVLRDEFKTKVTQDEIRKYLAEKFVKWQLPDEILYVTNILKTSVGKIDKKAIRMKYKEIYTSK